MGRILKRVPMDFDAPLGEVWKGYLHSEAPAEIQEMFPIHSCNECDAVFGICEEDADYCIIYNPKWRDLWYFEPPEGDGYQLWENTTEGSPISPVFATAEDLAEWCENGATIWGTEHRITKDDWLTLFNGGPVALRHKIGDIEVIFV